MAVERENFLLCLRFFTPAEPEEPLGTGEGPCASLNGDFTNSNLVGLGGLNNPCRFLRTVPGRSKDFTNIIIITMIISDVTLRVM